MSARVEIGGRTASRCRLLTVQETAAALALKPSTIRAWILKRQIATVRPGGRAVRIPSREIDRIIAEGTTLAKS